MSLFLKKTSAIGQGREQKQEGVRGGDKGASPGRLIPPRPNVAANVTAANARSQLPTPGLRPPGNTPLIQQLKKVQAEKNKRDEPQKVATPSGTATSATGRGAKQERRSPPPAPAPKPLENVALISDLKQALGNRIATTKHGRDPRQKNPNSFEKAIQVAGEQMDLRGSNGFDNYDALPVKPSVIIKGIKDDVKDVIGKGKYDQIPIINEDRSVSYPNAIM